MGSDIIIYNASDFDFELKKITNEIKEKKPKTVLVWSSGEYELPGGREHYDLNYLDDICVLNGTNIYIVFGFEDVYYYKETENFKNIKFLFWPTFLLHFTYYLLHPYYSDNIDEIKIDTKFNNLFVCFNNKPHYHRCMIMDKLFESGLLDKGKVSWCELSDDVWSCGYLFNHWNEKIIKIDEFKTTEKSNDDRTDFLLNNESFLFLVTESTTDCEFITEKTFKPILIEQPFLCVASKNQNTILKKYGFKLYDEIFDYSFDVEDSLEKRVDGVIKNIKNLEGKDLNIVYDSLREKILYNKKVALEIINNDIYVPKKLKEIYINNDLINNKEFLNKSYGFINEIFKKIL